MNEPNNEENDRIQRRKSKLNENHFLTFKTFIYGDKME
jgi:hypothetical protein